MPLSGRLTRQSRFLTCGPERVRGQIAQKLMPGMFRILLDLRNQELHFPEDRRLRLIIDVSLQKLQNIQTITFVGNEIRKQHIKAVVHTDKVVPVFRPLANRFFKCPEARPREIVALQRAEDIPVGEPRAVERNAHSGGKNGIDESSCVAHEHETVAAYLLHGVAVVAFFLEAMKPLRTTEGVGDTGTAADAVPEELFPVQLRPREVLLLGNHADTRNLVGNGNLPNPAIRYG